jgi:hypothetical protein
VHMPVGVAGDLPVHAARLTSISIHRGWSLAGVHSGESSCVAGPHAIACDTDVRVAGTAGTSRNLGDVLFPGRGRQWHPGERSLYPFDPRTLCRRHVACSLLCCMPCVCALWVFSAPRSRSGSAGFYTFVQLTAMTPVGTCSRLSMLW